MGDYSRGTREMPRGRAYSVTVGGAQNRYKDLPQEELAARMQKDIAPYFGGAAPTLDPATLRHHNWNRKGMPTMSGFVIPADITDEELARRKKQYSYKDKDGNTEQLPMDKGTINLVGNQPARIAAHEVRHFINEDGNGETYNRLADAATAQNYDDWEGSVFMWHDKMRRQKPDRKILRSEAQQDLIKQLQTNYAVMPRGLYKKDYARGARLPGTEPSWWQRPSAQYEQARLDNALWAQEAADLAHLAKWKKGLPARNAKRREGLRRQQ